MVSKKVKVVNPSGLHLRPAGVLSQTAMKFKSRTLIECGEKHIVAKSVLNVMAAGIKCGTEITVACDGPDEEEALKTITEAIESGLGEELDQEGISHCLHSVRTVTHISEPEGDIAERQKLQLCRYPFLDGKEGFLWN